MREAVMTGPILKPAAGIFAAVSFAFLALFSCGSKTEFPDISAVEQEPEIVVRDFRDIYNAGVKKIWMVQSKTGEIYKNLSMPGKDNIFLTEVYVEFYKNNKVVSSVKADKGEIDQSQKTMTGISNVVVISDDGSILYTDRLIYDDKIAKFVTDSRVKIVRLNGDVIEGIGMTADKNLEKVVIKKQIKGRFRDAEP